MLAATTPDPTRCPLCGQANLCAMETQKSTGLKQQPCWCLSASFSADLLARIPAESRNKACICAACAASPAPTAPSSPA